MTSEEKRDRYLPETYPRLIATALTGSMMFGGLLTFLAYVVVPPLVLWIADNPRLSFGIRHLPGPLPSWVTWWLFFGGLFFLISIPSDLLRLHRRRVRRGQA